MKNENAYTEPDRYQEVREKYSVHVSTVHEHIFNFRIYLLLEILSVFTVIGLV